MGVAVVKMSLADMSLKEIITDDSTEEGKKKKPLSTESRAPHAYRVVGNVKLRRKARNQGSSEAK